MYIEKWEFTIHFATINTQKNVIVFDTETKFTIHFATINTLLTQELL